MITVKQGDSHSSRGNDQLMRSFTNAIKRFGLVRMVKGKQTRQKPMNRLQRRSQAVLSNKKKTEYEYMEKTGKLARMKKHKTNQSRRP